MFETLLFPCWTTRCSVFSASASTLPWDKNAILVKMDRPHVTDVHLKVRVELRLDL